MKKIAYLFLILLTIQSYAQVRISGNIKNSSIEKVSIKGMDLYLIKEVPLIEGKFDLEISLKQGYYYLYFGNQSSTIYVSENDELRVSVDYSNYEKTVKFAGKASEPSNYLHQKGILRHQKTKDLKKFYSDIPKVFKKNILSLRTQLTKELSKYNVSESFKKDELQNLKYEYLYSVYKFAQLQDFYFEKEVTQPEEFKKEVSSVDYDNSELYSQIPYYRYLAEQKWEDAIAAQDSYYFMVKKFYEIKTRELQTSVFLDCYYKISKDEEKAEDYYKIIKNNATSEKFIKMAEAEYNKVKKLKKGGKSPLFTYEDVNGKKVSLSDFLGKYVYIDLWATWCKPCIAQIPDLKKLEHDYKDQNIVFVSISVDKANAKELWKKMVKKKKLKGVQLFADNSFDSDFVDAFGVGSIPTFILIGPDGEVVQRRSSKPSAEKIRNTFDKLLSKK